MKKSLLYLNLTVLILFGCNTGREITIPPAPQIELDSETGVYTVKAGKTICITPIVTYAEDALYTWTVGNNIVSREKELNFTAGQPGSVYVTLKVTNENGTDSEDLRIDVLALAPPVISLAVPDSGFSIAPDSLLILKPLISNSEKATCLWKVDSIAVANTLEYVFSSAVPGTFSVALECENEDGKDGISFSISVIRPIVDEPGEEDPGEENPDDDEPGDDEPGDDNPGDEGPGTEDPGNEDPGNDGPGDEQHDYFRPVSSSSRTEWDIIHLYLPAPGQFINETVTGGFQGENTQEKANLYAANRLRSGLFVSLGGFGGSLVLGFDHSIVNDGSYNLEIKGNAHENSSEPGIVWVMRDENGNGKPDDTWYELKGSEYGKTGTISCYEVTYYRPRAAGQPVQWTDNAGKSGTIDYLGSFHNQDTYYPLWITSDSYTLEGTGLEARNYLSTTNTWINPAYEWGYADNHNSALFRISDAVTRSGESANLPYIDFVKIQTGVNAKSGWIGELSTEICSVKDYNMVKTE
jgi:hypothetical protein